MNASRQRDRPRVLGARMIGPVVDEQLAVDPEADAVVALRVEGVRAARRRVHRADPADAERVGADARHGRAGAPDEVHGAVDAVRSGSGEVEVVVVRRAQPVAAGDLAERRRVGGVRGGRRDRVGVGASIRPAHEPRRSCRPRSEGTAPRASARYRPHRSLPAASSAAGRRAAATGRSEPCRASAAPSAARRLGRRWSRARRNPGRSGGSGTRRPLPCGRLSGRRTSRSSSPRWAGRRDARSRRDPST
jgi:hypothetical protein